MTTLPPPPFAANPGDRLTVVTDGPNGTDLKTGDLVTVIQAGIHVADGVPMPVVQVSTAYGPQLLTYNHLQPADDLPAYVPAEKDDVVDAFFFGIVGNDDDLRAWAVTASAELAKNDPATAGEPNGGGTAVAERPAMEQIGETFQITDPDGDVLEIAYYEQGCPSHGRHSAFEVMINDDDSVMVQSRDIDKLIGFLWKFRNHSRRPDGTL